MPRRPVVVCLAWAALATAMLLARAAHAGDPLARARESFRQAEAALERREFAAAAAAFELAASFQPHPSPLLNAAEAWTAAGEPTRAIADCDRVLQMLDVEPKFQAAARECVTRLAPRVGTLDLVGPRTVTVRVDDDAAFSLPAQRRVTPGLHHLVVTDLETSRTRALDVEVLAGQTRRVDTPASTEARAPAPERSASRVGPPAASWAAFGVAGVAAIVAGVAGAITLAAKSDYEDAPTPASRDAFHRDKAITNVAVGVAALSAAAGLVVWVATPSERSHVQVGLAPGGVLGRF